MSTIIAKLFRNCIVVNELVFNKNLLKQNEFRILKPLLPYWAWRRWNQNNQNKEKSQRETATIYLQSMKYKECCKRSTSLRLLVNMHALFITYELREVEHDDTKEV